jgi:medium-chain acyl-[acyl-carrier-protein] hydrolase
LFCFPYAGGGSSAFHAWQAGLPPDVEVCLVQLPGREARLREPLFTRLDPLVQALAQSLRSWLNVPFAFFGHSMGALISFELAYRMALQNEPGPIHLFVSGRNAPQVPDPNAPIHQLPEARFIEELRHYNGTPETILQNAELMQLFIPILRADFAIIETYVYTPRAPLNCPLSVFGGLQDHLCDQAGLAAWREQTRGVFRVRMFPGGHFFLHPARTPVLRAIAQDLQRP